MNTLLFALISLLSIKPLLVLNSTPTQLNESSNTDLVDDSNFTNLVVFARFNGEAEFIDNTYDNVKTKNIVDNMYNKSYYSVGEYFRCVSNDHLRMNTVYLFDDGGSLELSNTRSYYCEKTSTNPNGYEPNQKGSRSYDLLTDWSTRINQVLNKTNRIYDVDGNPIYDTSILDKDGNGEIDCLTIIYGPASSDSSASYNSLLWNYKDYYNAVEYSVNGLDKTSGNYVQMTVSFKDDGLYTDKNGYKIAFTAVATHETGHVFGLKDLYRSKDMSSKVYFMSAMAKHISPVPQYISSKERESLGWTEKDEIKTMYKNGEYTIHYVSDTYSNNDTICYKIDLGNNYSAYLEYRNFQNSGNRFDCQNKPLVKKDGTNYAGLNIKSGLVCFLARNDKKYPSNLNTSGNNWEMLVLGEETDTTRSNAALTAEDGVTYLNNKIKVKVNSITDDSLTFEIDGIDESTEPIVTGVSISTYKDSMQNGESFQFKATLDGNNLTGLETIDWSIQGNTSSNTKISSTGLLKVGSDENSSSIIVKASYGDSISDTKEIIITSPHTLVHHDKIDATCKDTGIKEYWYCEECNKYFLDNEHKNEITLDDLIIPVSDVHTPKTIPGVDSTCSKEGYTDEVICSVCGKVLTPSETIAKKKHIIKIIEGIKPTCEEDGLSDGKICSVCGEVVEEQKILPKTGHTPSDWIIDKNPTNTEFGSKHKECTICHKVLEEESIDKLKDDNSNNNNNNNNNQNKDDNQDDKKEINLPLIITAYSITYGVPLLFLITGIIVVVVGGLKSKK